MPNRLAATSLGLELRPSDVLSIAEVQLRCHLPLIGKLFRNIVDSVDLRNWKKRLVILNWTVVTGNGRIHRLQADWSGANSHHPFAIPPRRGDSLAPADSCACRAVSSREFDIERVRAAKF
jgi:hypothetical protein